MPPALADYFFIAGLEGHEPAIVRGDSDSTSPSRLSTSFGADGGKEVPSVHETILEESVPSEQASGIDKNNLWTEVSTNSRPTTPSSTETIGNVTFPTLPENSSEIGTNPSVFDDVIEKFASERDEFRMSLTPPGTAITPDTPSTQTTDEQDPRLSLNHIDECLTSSLRMRASVRNKFSEMTRHSTRSGTVRRHNTHGHSGLLKANNSVQTELI